MAQSNHIVYCFSLGVNSQTSFTILLIRAFTQPVTESTTVLKKSLVLFWLRLISQRKANFSIKNYFYKEKLKSQLNESCVRHTLKRCKVSSTIITSFLNLFKNGIRLDNCNNTLTPILKHWFQFVIKTKLITVRKVQLKSIASFKCKKILNNLLIIM